MVTIDDRIPTHTLSGAAAFTYARGRQAWAALLEKVRLCAMTRAKIIFEPTEAAPRSPSPSVPDPTPP